jgi:hypothetical protein
VRQVQRTSELVPLFDFPLTVELLFEDGRVARHRLRVREERERFTLPLGAPLADLVLDADCSLLCELALEKPLAMWVRQSRAEHAGLRWRALPELLARGGQRGEQELARAAHLERMRQDPEELLRARAALLWRSRREPAWLVERVALDPAARVRLVAAQGLAGFRLGVEERALLSARRAVEPSPAVRAELEALLAPRAGR